MTDLTRSHVDIPTPDGTADAYLTEPADGSSPPVLVFMDGIGLRPRLEQMADRISAAGYRVLVPNLFYRAGRAPLIPNLVERLQGEDRAAVFAELRPLMASLTPEAAARDTAAYVNVLAPEGPFATVGYCMGGGLALRAAGQFPERVVAVGSFHGGRLAPDDGSGPDLSAVRAEVYAAHADHDDSMPPEQIARFEQALEQAGVPYTSELYEGATHGFTMTDMPVHDPAAEQRHWDALLGLLDRRL